MNSIKGLSNDRLKIIAVVTMLTDHIGAYLFPNVMLFRMIGRISFPIFAFMIAEGCRYTKNKKRYLLNMAVLSLVTYLLFYSVSSPKFLRIPFTFTLSVIMIFVLGKTFAVFRGDCGMAKKCLYAFVALTAVILIWKLDRIFIIDYGFYGIMTPVLVSVVSWINNIPQRDNNADVVKSRIIMLATALWFVYSRYGGVQIYSFFAIPLLALYNGRRENILPKYFFYIFYPLHLAVIFAVKYLILT